MIMADVVYSLLEESQMGRPRSYTDEAFLEAVKTSRSFAEVFRKIGIRPTGGNYTHFKLVANSLNVDYSHFDNKADPAVLSSRLRPMIPLEKVMVKKSAYSRKNLKRRLLEAGLIENKCRACGIDEWLGKPLVLHLDHVNGDPTDHRRSNLQMLCPNCHSQTTTYANKKR